MKKTELDYIKRNKAWPFSFLYLTKALFILAPVGICMSGYFLFQSGLHNRAQGVILLGIGVCTLGSLFTALTIARYIESILFTEIRMKTLDTSAIEEVLSRHKVYSYKEYKKGYIVATTNSSWFTWGCEVITIILDENRILLNTRPDEIRQPVIFFRNRTSIKKLMKDLQNLG